MVEVVILVVLFIVEGFVAPGELLGELVGERGVVGEGTGTGARVNGRDMEEIGAGYASNLKRMPGGCQDNLYCACLLEAGGGRT